MARRSRSRKTRRTARRGVLARLRPWILLVAGVAIAFGAASFVLLDWRVRAQFGDTQWRVPAHVYTQPLELHDGRAIDRGAVVQHLDAVGYRRASELSGSGTYTLIQGGLRIHTRSFRFADGAADERRITVRFRGGRVASVQAGDGRVAIARVQPERMGRVHAGRRADRVPVRLAEVPDTLIEALIAVEDRDFRTHWGVQPSAIMRALIANIRAGRTVQGGSTLTQQLVKNFFLSNEQTLSRKFTEALMALSLEWHYSKDQILEAYLNEVYLGQDGERAIHGFGLGARFWFDRPLAELDVHELALLVGLVKGPSYHDPRKHPERALARRNTVLRILGRTDALADERIQAAIGQPLGVVPREAVELTAYPAYLDLVRRQLSRQYEDEALRSGGLRVYTHLDPIVQAAAERALGTTLGRLDGRDVLQGAAVVADKDSGALLAVVGDRDARRSGYNRALHARRSIGSLIKPAVYLTALEHPGRYTLATPLEDRALTVQLDNGDTWEPENYGREFHGRVPLIEALVQSYNGATARLGLELGLDAVGRTLERLRVHGASGLVPADLLGAVSLTPLEVTRMYQTFAAGGFDSPLKTIVAVQDPDGSNLTQSGLDVRQALPPAPVFLVNHALERVATNGTGRALRRLLPGREVAGKTGTTNELRDSWFAGFDGRRVGVVWVGRDDNRPAGLTGSAGALRVWADMMRRLPAMPGSATAPPDIEWSRVNLETARSLPARCTEAPRLPFIRGSVPQRAPVCGDVSTTMPGR